MPLREAARLLAAPRNSEAFTLDPAEYSDGDLLNELGRAFDECLDVIRRGHKTPLVRFEDLKATYDLRETKVGRLFDEWKRRSDRKLADLDRAVPFDGIQVCKQLASDLELQAAHEQAGLVDRFHEHRTRPLTEHVDDWHNTLLDNGGTPEYAKLSLTRVRAVLDGTKATFWPDLDANRVSAFLAERRRAGLSIETSNHYTRRIKQFALWMVKSKRAPDNPLDCLTLLNSRTDRRHDQRALTDDELRALLETTRNGPTRNGMTGPERAVLYQLAVETGLRARELRSLTWGSFDLYADVPTVTVKAAYSKHRRDDTLPLKASTVAMLDRWRDEWAGTARDPIFNLPQSYHLSKVIRADLQNAGIPYRDDAGRVADFHALRHTFVTNLARGGVHPKLAQQLARHSTISLTMDLYTHTVIGDLADGLNALPELSSRKPERERLRATGTCDVAPKSLPPGLPKSLPICLPTRAASQTSPVASQCTKTVNDSGVPHQENPVEQGASCAPVHRVAPQCTTGVDGNRTHQTPRKRRLNGFEGRGTHQASGHSLESRRDCITFGVWINVARARKISAATSL